MTPDNKLALLQGADGNWSSFKKDKIGQTG
jgi:hypothetical protein